MAGRRYANAWVTWRVPTDDYGYIGWAPMAPAWGWYGGVAIGLWWYPPSAYVFCPNRYAFSYHVHSYVVHDPHMVRDVAAHTRNYSNGYAGGGSQRTPATPQVLPANSAPPRGPSLAERAHSRVRRADYARAHALGIHGRSLRARGSVRRGRCAPHV